eukprot:g28460.t1
MEALPDSSDWLSERFSDCLTGLQPDQSQCPVGSSACRDSFLDRTNHSKSCGGGPKLYRSDPENGKSETTNLCSKRFRTCLPGHWARAAVSVQSPMPPPHCDIPLKPVWCSIAPLLQLTFCVRLCISICSSFTNSWLLF